MSTDTFTDVLKIVTYVVSYSSRTVELSVAFFLTCQFFKPNSNYKSAYFVILNIGYIVDLLVGINGVIPLPMEWFSYTVVMHNWHNIYFLTIWNTVLCLNRCTAMAFFSKHEKIWTPTFMFFVVILMLIFPFIIDGYNVFSTECSPFDLIECAAFRGNYYFKGSIVNTISDIILITFILFSIFWSKKTDKSQVHSLHAKIERRLIYQAIFSSLFQFIYCVLNFISSIVVEKDTLYILACAATIGYHLQHYAVMLTHFIFSPTFKMAYLNFYKLSFLSRNGRKVQIPAAVSKAALTTKASGARNTV